MNVYARAGAVFVGMTALDVAFALYVVTAAKGQVFNASAWAAAIQVFNVFVVSSFVKDNRMAIPSILGAFVGTWLALVYK